MVDGQPGPGESDAAPRSVRALCRRLVLGRLGLGHLVLGRLVLGGLVLIASSRLAEAQIRGAASPGTPGALEGEGMGLRRLETPALFDLPPEAARDGKTGLRKTANTAVAKRKSSLQSAPGGMSAPPTGGQTQMKPLPGAMDLTGNPFSSGRWTSPDQPAPAAPGLLPANTPAPRRSPPQDDPYAPLGLRVGSFTLLPSLEAGLGYDTNANQSATNRKSAAFYRTEGQVIASSGWSNHQLNLDLRGAYSDYAHLDNASRPELEGRAALRIDATRDITLESEVKTRLDTESGTSINTPGNALGRSNVYTNSAALGATRRFDRLSISLRGSVDRTTYADATTRTGSFDQSDRNLNDYTLRLRTGYEISPGISPFAELGVDKRNYDQSTDDAGYRRSSRGVFTRLGSSFEILRTLTGEAALGYATRTYDDNRLETLKAPTLDAALLWSLSPLTTMRASARSEIVETTVAGSSGAISYNGSVVLTHAFLRNFSASASLGLTKTDYDIIRRQETDLNAGLRLDYKFNRLMGMRGTYNVTRFSVNTPGENYQSHAVLLGMRITP